LAQVRIAPAAMVGKWADAEEDDFAPESPTGKSQKTRLVSAPDAQGVRTVVEYVERNGVNYKITKKVREKTVTSRVSEKAEERKNMPKFLDGCEKLDLNNVYMLRQVAAEDVKIEPRKRADKNEEEDKKILGDEKKSVWSKFRKDPAADAEKKDDAAEEDKPVDKLAALQAGGGNAPGKYVPPSLRAGSSTLEDLRLQEQRDRDALTLRVTNLSEDVREGDLSDLFGQFGRIQRIFLAKNPETKLSKGFAFITYHTKADAENSIKRLNGHGYDNLVLRVEWAKPQQRDEGKGAGPNLGGKGEFPALRR